MASTARMALESKNSPAGLQPKETLPLSVAVVITLSQSAKEAIAQGHTTASAAPDGSGLMGQYFMASGEYYDSLSPEGTRPVAVAQYQSYRRDSAVPSVETGL
jgi:hypothetical protein